MAEIRVRFRAPARYDDQIAIYTWLGSMDSSELHLVFKVRNAATGQALVDAETKYAFTSHYGEPINIADYPIVWNRLQNAMPSAAS